MSESIPTSATPAELVLHHKFVESVQQLKRGLVRSCHYLLQIQNRKVHCVFGYHTIAEYAAAEAGLTRAQCDSFLALARRLPLLPGVAAGIENGDLNWSQAKLLCRAATPATEQEWIETAKGLSVRSLAEVVRRVTTPVRPVAASTARPALVAPEPPSAPKPSFVTVAFHADRFAIWEAWLASARVAAPGAPTDELVTRLIEQGGAEVVVRLVIQRCPDCRSSVIATSRGDLAVTGALLARAACEAERQGPDGSVRRAVPPRLRRLVLARDGHRCQAEGCGRAQHLQVHHRMPIEVGGRATLDNLITLCGRCHRALHEREEALKAATVDPAG
ncbi:MAG: HNH endonuclease signature motif containing protein [Candidatus Latescibacteria bacterium]|nr:HNH endonuclease signature motif containing protein [Candidatus Latescibacterota bacterium]